MHSVTLRALELDAILERLAGHTTFSPTLESAREPGFARDLEEARRLQQETAEGRRYLVADPQPDLSSARDVRPAAGRAAKGAVLGVEELLAVQATLRTSASLRQALGLGPQGRQGGAGGRHPAPRAVGEASGGASPPRQALEGGTEEWPLLARLGQRLTVQKPLLQALERAIAPDGQILDAASPGLARVRAVRHQLQARLQSKLEHLLNAAETAPYLQERLITQRAGRYVLPVKAEAKGRVPGIVHDESASGQTLYVEPTATVEMNNELRRLEKEEEREIQAILAAFSAQVSELQPLLHETVERLIDLDLIFARAKYARELGASQPELLEAGQPLDLKQARHPLLDPETVVPIDIAAGGETPILLITGPNTGGKTVTLKTVGLCALMAQLGLHLPAAPGSRLPLYDAVLADIGDEQSIQQSLSTFSSHVSHIIDFLTQATPKSLLLLDELGAGTDPVEGAALARALIAHLLERGSTVLATTHYSELKVFAHHTPGVRNASVEFDPQTLAPTYRLTIGLPGRSNALAIARRLGLEASILDEAARWVPISERELDSLLQDIRASWEEARRREAEVQRLEQEAEKLRLRTAEELAALERHKEAMREEARREVEQELSEVWEALREARRGLAEMRQPEALEEVGAELEAIQEELAPPAEPASLEELRPGDRVWHRRLNQEGEVLATRDGEVELQVGAFRLTAAPEELTAPPGIHKGRPQPHRRTTAEEAAPRDVPGEIHLRGLRVEEALDRLESYLSDATLAGRPSVRVVHGKGSGRLREAVREHLRRHPLVRQLQQPDEREGGSGVTEVLL